MIKNRMTTRMLCIKAHVPLDINCSHFHLPSRRRDPLPNFLTRKYDVRGENPRYVKSDPSRERRDPEDRANNSSKSGRI